MTERTDLNEYELDPKEWDIHNMFVVFAIRDGKAIPEYTQTFQHALDLAEEYRSNGLEYQILGPLLETIRLTYLAENDVLGQVEGPIEPKPRVTWLSLIRLKREHPTTEMVKIELLEGVNCP